MFTRRPRQWPELMALTVALCSATQPSRELKVVGLDLVNIIAEFCSETLSPHQTGLLQVSRRTTRRWRGGRGQDFRFSHVYSAVAFRQRFNSYFVYSFGIIEASLLRHEITPILVAPSPFCQGGVYLSPVSILRVSCRPYDTQTSIVS